MNRCKRYVSSLKATPIFKKVQHYRGYPDGVQPEGANEGERLELGVAAKLLIEETADGVFLYRYSKMDHLVGDTWHASVEDAMRQADFEFGELIGDWISN